MDTLDLTSLGKGDIVEAGPFMPTLSDEQVVLKVVSTTKFAVTMEATYFGVKLGKMTAPKHKEAK